MKTVVFQPIDLDPTVEFAAPAEAELLDIVMRGDTPHLVVSYDDEMTRPDPAKPTLPAPDYVKVVLKLVAPGGEVPTAGAYVGSFFARGFFSVYRVQ